LTINRRNFLFSLGASATLPALASMGHAAQPVTNENQPRSRVDLNGTWERLVQDEHYDLISVPSSNRPIGQSLLKREFTLPKLTPGMRAFIHPLRV
jgi:hypothetical protein